MRQQSIYTCLYRSLIHKHLLEMVWWVAFVEDKDHTVIISLVCQFGKRRQMKGRSCTLQSLSGGSNVTLVHILGLDRS